MEDRFARDEAGGPSNLFLDGHHRSRLRSGLRTDRTERETFPSARIRKDLRHVRRRPSRSRSTPILCTLLLRGKFHSEDQTPVMRFLQRHVPSRTVVARSSTGASRSWPALDFSRAQVAGCRNRQRIHAAAQRRRHQMFMPIADPSICSLAQNTEYANRQDEVLSRFPEVAYVAAKVARADTSTDPGRSQHDRDHRAFEAARPVADWHDTPEASRAKMDRAVSLPGVANIWTQAHHQSHRNADDRHPLGDWRQSLRLRSDGA